MFLSNGSLVTKTPISLTSSSWFPSMPPMSSNGWPSAYAGMYSSHLWVYVVVSKRARATARLPLPVYKRDDLNRPRADDHAMAKLLRSPNPGLSGFNLWLWTSSTFDIYGDTFWYKQRRNGAVVGLYPLHPSAMTYHPDKRSWTFDNGSLVIDDIADTDLVHFQGFNPESTTRGLSPLEPLRSTLHNEWHARNSTSSFWENGARPGTALVHPGNLSEPAAARLKAQYDAVSRGSGKTGSTVVLEEGMEPKTLTLTAEEAQYIETRKLNREEVCAAYDVPPPVVHILDHATFSNITEQMRSMYRDTMAPHLKAFEAAIELDLRAAEFPNDDVYAEFMMDEVLRGDFETRQEALQKASHMTIAEKRKIENLPFIEGTDRIFLNAAEVPLSAPQNDDAPAAPPFQQVGLPALVEAGVISREDARQLLGISGPPPEVAPAESPQKAYLGNLDEVISDAVARDRALSGVRSVMGRLSWQKTLDQIDTAALVEGLDESESTAVLSALAFEKAEGGSVAGLRDRLRGTATKEAKASKVKAADTSDHEARVRALLAGFFARQGRTVLASGSFDSKRWDAELTADLHATAVAVSSAIGKSALRTLGFDSSVYDISRTVDFLQAVSARMAGNINATTREQYEAALADDEADPADVFAKAEESRAPGIATGVTTLVAGFAVTEAGKRIGESTGTVPTKTWLTGSNPRATHAAMNGETVGIDDEFSNGMKWPGESGDVDDVAGCNCSVEVTF